MEAKIEQYLEEEKGIASEVVREMTVQKVTKYADIAEEFARWLETRTYEGTAEAGGYTARQIYEMAPQLDGIGVFNFMVTLRDDPETAQEIMRAGFVTR